MADAWLRAEAPMNLPTEAEHAGEDYRVSPTETRLRVSTAVEPGPGSPSPGEYAAAVRTQGPGAGVGLERECDPHPGPGLGPLGGPGGRSRGLQDSGGGGIDGAS